MTIVEAMDSRNQEFEPFAFEIFDGIPLLVDNHEIKTAKNKAALDVTDIEDSTLDIMFENIYKNGDKFTHSELMNQIQLEFAIFGPIFFESKRNSRDSSNYVI